MSIRNFNYTGKKEINHSDVEFILQSTSNDEVCFNAIFHLERYKFPDDALLFVEVLSKTNQKRFSFGTIGNIERPVDTRLVDFVDIDLVKFRVKVTDVKNNPGLILGDADKIKPKGKYDDNDKRSPLLSVQPSNDLGDEIFRIDMDSYPILLINARLENWKEIASSVVFQSLTAPSILRQILIHILIIDDYDDCDDSDPKSRWLRFALSILGGTKIPPDIDKYQRLSWIEEVVGQFATRKVNLQAFLADWKG